MSWFLYLVIAWGGSDFDERLLAMPDEETCITHLVSARLEVNDGAENEHAVFAVCTQGVMRPQSKGRWAWEDPEPYWYRMKEAE